MTDYIALAREVGADLGPLSTNTMFTLDQLTAFAARIAQAAPEDAPFGWFSELPSDGNPKAGPIYIGCPDETAARLVAKDEGKEAFPLYRRAALSVAPSQKAAGTEPPGCPTPGACSCPPSQDREDAALLALERITHSYRLLLAGKPVRDAAETLAEADAAIAARQAPKEPKA